MEDILAAVEADPGSLGLILHGSARDRPGAPRLDVILQTPARLRRLADRRRRGSTSGSRFRPAREPLDAIRF
ncbi:MAG: hypothetical protein ACRDL2_16550 [Gaiellaceae bacterium]